MALTQLNASSIQTGVIVNEPVGSIMGFTSSTVPTNFLECDGSAISRTTYSSLFDVIGTTYGSGDGSTTFNIPDLRGQFTRGWDNGAGTDSGRSLGSSQNDDFASHQHYLSFNSGNPQNDFLGGSTASYGLKNDAVAENYSTTGSGGTETRPKNVTLMFCIRYQ